MMEQEKIISEANKYVMPAVDDYLGARCLLLNNIFVGLTLAHEAVEKLIKALLVLEKIEIPKSCHKLSTLAKLLINRDASKYKILNNNTKFIHQLDLHYGWRYYNGDLTKRSQTKSPEDLHPFDILWVTLYKIYMGYLPQDYRFRTYLLSFLLDERLNEYTNWGNILIENNKAIEEDLDVWRAEWKNIFKKKIVNQQKTRKINLWK